MLVCMYVPNVRTYCMTYIHTCVRMYTIWHIVACTYIHKLCISHKRLTCSTYTYWIEYPAVYVYLHVTYTVCTFMYVSLVVFDVQYNNDMYRACI